MTIQETLTMKQKTNMTQCKAHFEFYLKAYYLLYDWRNVNLTKLDKLINCVR
jgi:hypothetical protein